MKLGQLLVIFLVFAPLKVQAGCMTERCIEGKFECLVTENFYLKMKAGKLSLSDEREGYFEIGDTLILTYDYELALFSVTLLDQIRDRTLYYSSWIYPNIKYVSEEGYFYPARSSLIQVKSDKLVFSGFRESLRLQKYALYDWQAIYSIAGHGYQQVTAMQCHHQKDNLLFIESEIIEAGEKNRQNPVKVN